MVMLYTRWYEHTGDEGDLRRATISFEWFMGRNDLGLPLFHAERGSCHDGLMERGINQNQGAEIDARLLAVAQPRGCRHEPRRSARTNTSAEAPRGTMDSELQQQLDQVALELPDRSEAA